MTVKELIIKLLDEDMNAGTFVLLGKYRSTQVADDFTKIDDIKIDTSGRVLIVADYELNYENP